MQEKKTEEKYATVDMLTPRKLYTKEDIEKNIITIDELIELLNINIYELIAKNPDDIPSMIVQRFNFYPFIKIDEYEKNNYILKEDMIIDNIISIKSLNYKLVYNGKLIGEKFENSSHIINGIIKFDSLLDALHKNKYQLDNISDFTQLKEQLLERKNYIDIIQDFTPKKRLLRKNK